MHEGALDVSVIQLKPTPLDGWSFAETVFGRSLTEFDLIGSIVDVKSVISGRGSKQVIRQVLESATVIVEVELPYKIFREMGLQALGNT